MNKFSKKDLCKYLIGGLILLGFLYFVSSIDKEILEEVTVSMGSWGFVFFFFIILCTQIFAPLSGSAFYFVGIKLFGFEKVLFLYYLVSMLSAIICYFIAHKWGRRVVIKFVGKKAMSEIDEISQSHERSLLVVGRTLGYFFFDFISYALGLTKISFKKYFVYTVFLTLIPTLLQYFVFKGTDFDNFGGFAIYYGSVALTGVIFAFLFTRTIKNSRKGLNKNVEEPSLNREGL